jgi:hypothetical protein
VEESTHLMVHQFKEVADQEVAEPVVEHLLV